MFMITLPADEAVAPLLDMANCSQDVRLLAEVASALVVMAQDPMVAMHLRTPCAHSVLRQLQQVNDFSVALPASHLLSCI